MTASEAINLGYLTDTAALVQGVTFVNKVCRSKRALLLTSNIDDELMSLAGFNCAAVGPNYHTHGPCDKFYDFSRF